MRNSKTIPNVMGLALIVRLEFDGSLRPPRDFGFPTIPAKLVTCSSSLSIGQDSSNDGVLFSPFALGCRRLVPNLGLTSAQTEYEGLLLGLEFLNDLESFTDLVSKEETSTTENSLLIIGDCKAVIDQINGKSIPRKMGTMHERSVDIMTQLGNKFDMVEARHIPRTENILCDSLCADLMTVIEWQEYNDCQTELWMCHDEPSKTSAGDVYTRYLKDENKCHIPYSKRPSLYQSMVSLSRTMDEFDTLVEVGERRLKESALTGNKDMAREAIQNQIDGWKGLGDTKKVEFLSRKHRYLLANPMEDDSSNDILPREMASLLGANPIEWKKEWLTGCQCQQLVETFRTRAMSQKWDEGSSTLWVTRCQDHH